MARRILTVNLKLKIVVLASLMLVILHKSSQISSKQRNRKPLICKAIRLRTIEFRKCSQQFKTKSNWLSLSCIKRPQKIFSAILNMPFRTSQNSKGIKTLFHSLRSFQTSLRFTCTEKKLCRFHRQSEISLAPLLVNITSTRMLNFNY